MDNSLGGLEMSIKKHEKKMKTAIILPDIHAPYQDALALNTVNKYIKWKKPDKIIIQGDLFDMYQISRFDKDPGRIGDLQSDIDQGIEVLKQIKLSSPNSEIVLIEGNHEARLQKYLMKNPELHGLQVLKPEILFGLKDLGIKYVTADQTYKLNNSLVITHGATDDGCKLSQHAGYSAKNTMDKWGNISGIMGHGHRIGMSTKTMADGTMVQWVENGCLCDLHPSYVKNPNWQHGFSVVKYTPNRFHITPIVIAKYEFIADNKLWK